MTQSILSLIILAAIIICFITRVMPLGVTAVAGAAAMAATGIISFADVFSSFMSDTVMLVAGMIVVGSALTETGVADHVGKKLMNIPGVRKSERLFLLILLIVVAVLSGFMSNTATVAIFLPLIDSAVRGSGGRITRKNTYMAVGVSSVVGGNLTLIGSTPQIIAQGILSSTEGCTIMTFFELGKGALPLIAVMLIYYFTVGYSLQKKVLGPDELAALPGEVLAVNKKPTSVLKMAMCVIVFLLGVAALMVSLLPAGQVAAGAACICILTRCISLKKAVRSMDWTSIMVLGGSMGFSKGLDKSGALQMISDHLLGFFGETATPILIMGTFLVLAAIMGNVMSHTATTSVLVPIVIAVAKGLGSNPTLFAIAVVIGCNLAFTTPISTPPLTMTLKGGYRFNDYVMLGGPLNVICIVVAIITLPLIYSI
ncbi:MAG: SLC13 family permease [Clostridiales bacterium]|nr:SLC13 family permease [Clostridiales bacterium]